MSYSHFSCGVACTVALINAIATGSYVHTNIHTYIHTYVHARRHTHTHTFIVTNVLLYLEVPTYHGLCAVIYIRTGYEISQRLKKAAFEGALTISKKKKATKGEDLQQIAVACSVH